MQLSDFIQQLQQRDIRLWLQDGQLRFSAPQGALDEPLRQQIQQQKTAIIEFLQQTQDSPIRPLSDEQRQQAQVLSFAQERLSFLYQLQQNPAFHLQQLLCIRGALDMQRLQSCLNQIIEQHSVLRTAYRQTAQGMRQQVLPFQTFPLRLYTADEKNFDIQALAAQESQKPFDLSQGEVFRYCLIQLSEQHFFLLSTFHHIAVDGQTLNLIADKLSQLYRSGEALPASDYQYQDFAVWQRQPDQQARFKQQLEYWKTQLGAIENLRFTYFAQTDAEARSQQMRLDKPTSQALKQLAKQHQVSLFMLLLALFSSLLYRYLQQDNFCIGTPVSLRKQAPLADMLGCLINLVAIRCEHQSLSFNQHLMAVKAQVLAAHQHQDVPFEQVVKELVTRRDWPSNPLFQVLFSLQESMSQPASQWQGLSIESLDVAKTACVYDLSLNTYCRDEEIIAEWVYRQSVFSDQDIARLSASFQRLIQSVLTSPDAPLSRLNFVSDEDIQRQLYQFNPAQLERFQGDNVAQWIEQQAAKTPQATALLYQHSQLSYQALNEQANRLAHYLKQHARGAFVAVCLPRSLQLPVALLAVIKAGLAYLPLDHSLPQARLRQMLADANCQMIIGDSAAAQQFADYAVLDLANSQALLATYSQANVSLDGAARVFNLIYTSGTTGKAKGVLVSHQAIINRLVWMQSEFALSANDCVLHKTSIGFDVSVWEIFWPLMFGAKLLLAEPDKQHDAAYLQQLISQQAVSFVHFVPSMLALFLRQADAKACCSLKALICSGESLSAGLAAQCQQQLPCALYNLYGPTEAAIDVSFYRCQGDETQIPIGKPIDNCRLYIADSQQQLLPIGAVGEILIGGLNVADGYLNQAELSQQSFIDNPFIAGDRLYRTGDMGRLDEDGQLYFLGRRDSQVKIRGFRVELKEIEQILLQHANIAQALLRCVQPQGKELDIVAYFSADKILQDEDLRHFLAQFLPSYMLPRYFIQLDEWPLTPHGKIADALLPAPDWRQLQQKNRVLPRDEIEQAIAKIWQDILMIPVVGIDDDFFSLGGHSLLASLAIIQIQEHFNVSIALAELFSQPTIRQAGELVRQAQNNKNIVIEGPLKEGEKEIHL